MPLNSNQIKKGVFSFQIIFGTGDSLKAVTLTANSGFVRAAYQQVRGRTPKLLL